MIAYCIFRILKKLRCIHSGVIEYILGLWNNEIQTLEIRSIEIQTIEKMTKFSCLNLNWRLTQIVRISTVSEPIVESKWSDFYSPLISRIQNLLKINSLPNCGIFKILRRSVSISDTLWVIRFKESTALIYELRRIYVGGVKALHIFHEWHSLLTYYFLLSAFLYDSTFVTKSYLCDPLWGFYGLVFEVGWLKTKKKHVLVTLEGSTTRSRSSFQRLLKMTVWEWHSVVN